MNIKWLKNDLKINQYRDPNSNTSLARSDWNFCILRKCCWGKFW